MSSFFPFFFGLSCCRHRRRRRDATPHEHFSRPPLVRSFVRIPTTSPDDVYYLAKAVAAAATATATFVGRTKLLAALTWQTFLLSSSPPPSDAKRRDATPPPQLSRSLSPSLGNIASKQPVWAPIGRGRGRTRTEARTDGRTDGRTSECARRRSFVLPFVCSFGSGAGHCQCPTHSPHSAGRQATDCGQRRPARRSQPPPPITAGQRTDSFGPGVPTGRRHRRRRRKICQLLRRIRQVVHAICWAGQ